MQRKLLFSSVFASALASVLYLCVPLIAYAAPAACSGAAQVSQDPTTKVWTCGFQTPNALQGFDTSIKTFNDDGTPADVGGVATQDLSASGTATNQDKSGKIVTQPTSCAGTWNFITSPGTCITRALFAGIGSFLIYVGIQCLTASGLLFEAILKYTVVSFQTPMYASVQDAVNNAWTVFRDISNILIIGFFTFIAISTILGISEYGAKKLLSRVLIVAVLINFSLLFTKLIIDGSNFTAYQFYNASISGIDGASYASAANKIPTTGSTQAQDNGIAGTFIQYLGVTGIGDSYQQVSAVQEANDSAVAGLVLGVLGFIFLISTALVFLYGSFILAARAILFIFLLITSSLAFATYLIPKLSDNYGWSKWWASLFKNALLAPILMMMLWVTLTVSAGISKSIGAQGTLGALIQNPTATGNITALMNFVIILGLLFASFKLASKFSGGIGGFNFAALLPALGLAAGAQAIAFGGRHAIGRPAALLSEKMENASKNQSRSLFSRQLFDFGAQKTKGIAKRDFNAMRTPLGGALGAASGLKADVLAGKKIGGALGAMESTAHAIAERARRITPGKDDKTEQAAKAIAGEIQKNVDLSSQHSRNTEVHENAKSDHKEATEQLANITRQHEQEMKALHDAAASATSQGAAESAQQNIITARNQHAQAIQQQTERIKQASQAVAGSHAEIQRVEEAAKQIAIAKGIIPEEYKSAASTAADIAHGRLTSGLFTSAENDRLAHMAEHEVGHAEKKKKFKEVADVFKEVMGPEEPAAPAAPAHAPAAPAAPHTPPPADNHGGGGEHH